MYTIRLNKAEELKHGETYRYIAKELGITEGFVSNIFRGKKKCSLIIAKGIISIRYNIPMDDNKIEIFLFDFFKKC